MKLKLKDIRIDGGTQPRVEIDESLVAEYAEDMQDGDKFDPVIIFNDGANYWLADGFHRYHASKKVGYLEINAKVESGTKQDAFEFSLGANASHGKRRTNRDKENAIKKALSNKECKDWSDNRIAKACNVSPHTVKRVRDDFAIAKSDKRKGADGRTIDTSNIGNGQKESTIVGPNTEATDMWGDSGDDIPDNVDPETGEVLGEEEETKEESRERKGIGLEKAHEAIAVLSRIPPNDDLLQEGYDIVIQWINRNR